MTDRPTAPLSAILSLVNDKVLSRKNPNRIYVGLEDIPSGGTSLISHGWATDSVSTNNVFKAGDVLFGKLRPRLRKSIRIDRPGYCSTDILVLRPTAGVDPEFAGYVAQSDTVFTKAVRTEEGTKMPRCSWQQIQSVHVFLPTTRNEQRSIVRFLACMDRAIDRTTDLIAKQQQVKAGLLQAVFSRGVLPDGELRPTRASRPELYRETEAGWLPVDWRLDSLGRNAKIVSGVTLGSKEASTNALTVPYLRVANVQDGYLDLRELKTVKVSANVAEQLRLLPGDVLMNEGGDFDKLGRGAVWSGEIENCIHQNHVFRVRCNNVHLLPEFLAYFTESDFGKRYFRVNSKQSTNLASINSKQLHAYPVALPHPKEQERIAHRVQKAVRAINSLQAEVDKLRMRKRGLMADLLTGRVSVEHLAPELASA
ncbi:MAG: restriction endonuclease subunit S [Hydrogenophaga sp.]|jgi:type I restriction enzyme S subunit|nr:restriction endonuclease subunit S [Hydrogenophaga sp.]